MKSDTCFSRFLLDNHPELHGFASRSEATGLVIIKKRCCALPSFVFYGVPRFFSKHSFND